ADELGYRLSERRAVRRQMRAKVVERIDGMNAGELKRSRFVDPADTRMRERAAHECGGERSRELYVGDERSTSGKQERIFDTPHPLADAPEPRRRLHLSAIPLRMNGRFSRRFP